jgi:hypothetical protein
LCLLESHLDFIRRISKDLRGTDPTPAEIHFFVASKDAGRRQKLIDLFIQERQEQEEQHVKMEVVKMQVEAQRAELVAMRLTRFREVMKLVEESAGLGTLQKDFYKELLAAKEKGDVAKITQAYLDRLINFVKTNPKSQDIPDAMRQITFVYESQGKTVEAGAWRDKLLKEHPKIDKSAPGE